MLQQRPCAATAKSPMPSLRPRTLRPCATFTGSEFANRQSSAQLERKEGKSVYTCLHASTSSGADAKLRKCYRNESVPESKNVQLRAQMAHAKTNSSSQPQFVCSTCPLCFPNSPAGSLSQMSLWPLVQLLILHRPSGPPYLTSAQLRVHGESSCHAVPADASVPGCLPASPTKRQRPHLKLVFLEV